MLGNTQKFEDDRFFIATSSESPLVATAIHSGHQVRDELVDLLAISEQDRLREEDPFTDRWTVISKNRVIVNKSRFEVDLNRPRENAVYIHPEDAWGLNVWRREPDRSIIERSLGFYDEFYLRVETFLQDLVDAFGYFVLLDLHSYNHRRQGPQGPLAPQLDNPEVNVGTGNLDRIRWGQVVDRFIRDLQSRRFQDRFFDVRENVKFRGGHFSKWICDRFPVQGCVLAVEFKKFFMDEWTGLLDVEASRAIELALSTTVPGLLEQTKVIVNPPPRQSRMSGE